MKDSNCSVVLILEAMDIVYNRLMNHEGCTVAKLSSEAQEGKKAKKENVL